MAQQGPGVPYFGKCCLVGVLGRPGAPGGARWQVVEEGAGGKDGRGCQNPDHGKGPHAGSHHLKESVLSSILCSFVTNPLKHLLRAGTRLGLGEIERGQELWA